MRRIVRAFIAPTVAILSLLPLTTASADALPFDRRVELGRPSRTVDISLRIEGGEAVLRARVGSRRLRRPLGIPSVDEVDLELLEVDAGVRVALLRLRSGTTRFGALLVLRRGGPVIPWLQRISLEGDPGERAGWALRASPSGEHRDILVGRIREGVGLCGTEPALIDPRRLDPISMRLVAAEAGPVPTPDDDPSARGMLESPGPTRPPTVRGLGLDEAVPEGRGGLAALGDRDPSTVWSVANGSGSAFFRARWLPAGRPLRALAFFAPAEGAELPDAVWLVGDGGARVRVELPRPRSPRAPVWFVPSAPLAWNCLSIVFDREGSSRLGFSEVWAYSDLDFGTGMSTLVGDLASGGRSARAAARLLSSLGASATEAIVAAWPDMTSGERRLALGALSSQARRLDVARAALLTIAKGSDPEMAESALGGLLGAGAAGERLAAELVADPRVGRLASRELSRRSPVLAAPALLNAFAAAPADRRPDLRQSLGTALNRGGEEVVAQLGAWAASPHPAIDRTQVGLAIAGRGDEADAIAASLHAAVAPGAEGFEERWYLLELAASLPPSEERATFAAATARDAEEWMLRAAALAALPRLDAGLAAEVAKESLGDPYPRVRVAALDALAALELADEAVGALAVHDSWPIVRTAAIVALGSNPEALPLIRAAVRDSKPRVRAAAIATLSAAGDREAWPTIRERLESDVERLEVLRAAIEYTSALCLREALPTLEAVIDRGRRPDAREVRLEAAVAAVVAVSAIGGEGSRPILEAAASPNMPRALGSVAQRALGESPRCEVNEAEEAMRR